MKYCNVCCSERCRRRGVADWAGESSAHGGVLVYRLQRRTTLHQQAGRAKSAMCVSIKYELNKRIVMHSILWHVV